MKDQDQDQEQVRLRCVDGECDVFNTKIRSNVLKNSFDIDVHKSQRPFVSVPFRTEAIKDFEEFIDTPCPLLMNLDMSFEELANLFVMSDFFDCKLAEDKVVYMNSSLYAKVFSVAVNSSQNQDNSHQHPH